MKRCQFFAAVFFIILAALAISFFGRSEAARADGILNLFHPANHKYQKQEPYKPNLGHNNTPTMTMVQLANVVDIIEHDLREDGTVVIQQPSVWGQARMTVYRKDYENEMKNGIGQFKFILSARVARSDQASLQSQTSLAASLSPGGAAVAQSSSAPAGISLSDLAKANSDLLKSAKDADPVKYANAFDLLTNVFKTIGVDNGNLGLEPTVYLDEKNRYLQHLNELRRINMGDDSADSAGYGLYLIRMPVSIEPGQKTDRGHGASLTVTAEHDFHAQFLERTYRNLVINDLLDQLTPVFFQILDHNLDKGLDGHVLKKYIKQRVPNELELAPKQEAVLSARRAAQQAKQALDSRISIADPNRVLDLSQTHPAKSDFTDSPEIESVLLKWKAIPRFSALTDFQIQELSHRQGIDAVVKGIQRDAAPLFKSMHNSEAKLTTAETCLQATRDALENAPATQVTQVTTKFKTFKLGAVPATIVNGKSYPVAPSDKIHVFAVPGQLDKASPSAMTGFLQFLLELRASQNTALARATDVRQYLQHELEAAYDFMEKGIEGGIPPLQNTPILDRIVEDFKNRSFDKKTRIGSSTLHDDFMALMAATNPGTAAEHLIADKSLGFLCWAIAVDASLLNERLIEDMERLNGHEGFHCKQPMQARHFYLPHADRSGFIASPAYAEAEQIFIEYVKKRWPLICFAVDPVVDQQNIADALSLRRDLQLAVAFAFSTGQIGFNQMMAFHRQISVDAETIALNRTVTCFAHGNDTFGWRFTPRYQNPPSETNARVITELLVRSGPNPKYQVNKSKLERGQRELTAVVVMPSFLNSIQVNMRGNYFKLAHPENLTISSGRMLEQGRVIMELESNSLAVCDKDKYRAEDVRGVEVKLQQIMKMLPIQKREVFVPYENTLGGFDLFVPGTTALVPIIAGYDGIDQVNPTSDPGDAKTSQSCFFLYGKHFSILETKVLAGGRFIPDTDVEILSREVMRVKIAKDVQPTKTKDNRAFVEVVVATPAGVSNRVLVPIVPAKTTLMELQTKTVAAQVCCDASVFTVKCVSPAQITLNWKSNVLVNKVTLKATLASNKDVNFTLADLVVDAKKQNVVIDVTKGYPDPQDPTKTKSFIDRLNDMLKAAAVSDAQSFKFSVVSYDNQQVIDDSGTLADPLAVTMVPCPVLPVLPPATAPALADLASKSVTAMVVENPGKKISVPAISPNKIVLAWNASPLPTTFNVKFTTKDSLSKDVSFSIAANDVTIDKNTNNITVPSNQVGDGLAKLFNNGVALPTATTSTVSLAVSLENVAPQFPTFSLAVPDPLKVTVFRCPPPVPALVELQSKTATVMIEVDNAKKTTVTAINPEQITLTWKGSTVPTSISLKISAKDTKAKEISCPIAATEVTIDKNNNLAIKRTGFSNALACLFNNGVAVPTMTTGSVSVTISVDGVLPPGYLGTAADPLSVTVFRCPPVKK